MNEELCSSREIIIFFHIPCGALSEHHQTLIQRVSWQQGKAPCCLISEPGECLWWEIAWQKFLRIQPVSALITVCIDGYRAHAYSNMLYIICLVCNTAKRTHMQIKKKKQNTTKHNNPLPKKPPNKQTQKPHQSTPKKRNKTSQPNKQKNNPNSPKPTKEPSIQKTGWILGPQAVQAHGLCTWLCFFRVCLKEGHLFPHYAVPESPFIKACWG